MWSKQFGRKLQSIIAFCAFLCVLNKSSFELQCQINFLESRISFIFMEKCDRSKLLWFTDKNQTEKICQFFLQSYDSLLRSPSFLLGSISFKISQFRTKLSESHFRSFFHHFSQLNNFRSEKSWNILSRSHPAAHYHLCCERIEAVLFSRRKERARTISFAEKLREYDSGHGKEKAKVCD